MELLPTSTVFLDKRQLWGRPSASTSYSTPSCTPVTLAAGGRLTINSTSIITFTTDIIFQPNCADNNSYFYTGNSTVEGSDPFYSSTTVLTYVVAMATVIAWLLLTLLLIAPGHHVHKGTPKATGWLPGRSMGSILASGPVIVQFSARPWLQKAAAFLVTVALTIASAYTFQIAEVQYEKGIMNAVWMRDDIVGSLSIRIMRVVSDVFIWLAQVQTLIRLFPRRKEKLIIKWFGFLLILLDTVFSCLNSFYINSRELPRDYDDAIPALSYLFQLSISLLYGAWVFYYVATKRRYAFVHRDMPNITIVSLLAIVSILIPVAFFVADVSVPAVAVWGDFFRWVGAVAASVLVWEWVERIEFLEREEKKGGILGREIFEEDEMFDGGPPSKSTPRSDSSFTLGDSGMITRTIVRLRHAVIRITPRKRLKRNPSINSAQSEKFEVDPDREEREAGDRNVNRPPIAATSPPPTQSVTPLSRTETDTPSTIYTIQYHPISNTPPQRGEQSQTLRQIPETATPTSSTLVASAPDSVVRLKPSTLTVQEPTSLARPRSSRRSIYYAANMFKRGKRSPPLEVKQALSLNAPLASQHPRKALKRGLGRFVGVRDSSDGKVVTPEEPTVIPAPPRGHAWSPGDMRHSPMDLQAQRERGTMTPLDGALTRPPVERHYTGIVAATGAGTAEVNLSAEVCHEELAPRADMGVGQQHPEERTLPSASPSPAST